MSAEVPVRAIVAVLGFTMLIGCMATWYVRTFHPSVSLLQGAFGRAPRTRPLASQATDTWTTERTLAWMRSDDGTRTTRPVVAPVAPPNDAPMRPEDSL